MSSQDECTHLSSYNSTTFTLKGGKYTAISNVPFYANCTLVIDNDTHTFKQHVLYKERSSQLFFNFTREGRVKEVIGNKVHFQVLVHVPNTQNVPKRVLEIAGIEEEDESLDSTGMFFEASIDPEDETWLLQVDIGKGTQRKTLNFKLDDESKEQIMWEKRLFEMGR